MSRAVARRYRVRFAERGAAEVEGYVDFTLDVADLGEVPVVAGSLVHPLDGATELRPLQVLGVDTNGSLINAFVTGGRWAALGRLVDLQWQAEADDPDSDPWTTYGTGRCSGLDELDGPGQFRIEISDESWVARRGKVFATGGTTSIRPAGFVWGTWKGWDKVQPTYLGEIVDTAQGGLLVRVQLTEWTICPEGNVLDEQVEWIRSDLLPEKELQVPRLMQGNFKNLRLRYPDTQGTYKDWEVVTFGDLDAGIYSILGTLEEPEVKKVTGWYRTRVWAWIRLQSVVPLPPYYPPADSGYYNLYAPTAQPDKSLPLHVGMLGEPTGWAGNSGTYGYLHVADLTRRIWDVLGVRYDASSLDVIEADTSFPVVAPRITECPEDPEKWAQENLWGPLMLLALKDQFGRRKLKDIRPPGVDEDLSGLTVLDISNSKSHRWRLVGREQMNTVIWEYEWLDRVFRREDGEWISGPPDGLDMFRAETRTVPEIAGDTVPYAGRRARTFKVGATQADDTYHATTTGAPTDRAQDSGIGVPFIGDIRDAHTDLLLQVYQDGPVRGSCEIAGTVAETMEEGDYCIVDCRSVKIANAGTSARLGYVLVLLLSLTRYPTHAEAEYMVYRPVQVFGCPTGDELDTWLVSPLGLGATMRLALGALTEPAGDFAMEVEARKNAAGGQQVDMTVTLFEGNTEVAAWTETDLPATLATYTLALTSDEQAGITNWANLFLEIIRGGTTTGARADYRRLEVSRIGVAA